MYTSENLGALFTPYLALQPTTATGAAVNGEVIDRLADRPLHLSGKLIVAFDGAVASGDSLVIGAIIEHADEEGGPFTQLEPGSGGGPTMDESFTIAGADDGSGVAGAVGMDVNLKGAKQFIRAVVTPSGSADVYAVFALGGGEFIPAAGE